ncbi:MAG: nucleotidyltransferase domain-containing protein [Crocosphaera sp.]|nr:nucleotidyltransferase domain-containing protein [Crocosphaera sp.]
MRGEQTKDSDVDILVEFSKVPTLFDLVEIEYLISDKIGPPVDLIHKSGLRPHIRENVLKEIVHL